MTSFGSHVQARPRLYAAVAIGIACSFLPGESALSRALVGWNIAVWIYLVFNLVMMLDADHGKLRRVAVLQVQSAPVVLLVAVGAAVSSVTAIVFLLAGAGGRPTWQHLVLATATVIGSWLLMPVLFALDYAGRYYRDDAGGLTFPSASQRFQPDYADFLYFAVTIAVASQTADVPITSRPMRRLVLAQSVLSFFFNAAILALTINVAAGLFQAQH